MTIPRWLRVALLLLVAEKTVQHIAVTVAFLFDIGSIRASVAVDPRALLVAGAVSALLFALSGWGLIRRRTWALWLVVALALVDIAGEFIAQGVVMITLNVSFAVALALLALALLALRATRRQGVS